jgi:predicted RNase H-like HicB family nuclease
MSPSSSGVERILGKDEVAGSNPALGSILGLLMMLGDTNTKMKMVYWKGDRFWLGKLFEHPEIMSQGETLEELEENMRDAYLLMAMDEVPGEYQIKEIVI